MRELNNSEMSQITGGVDRKEYCTTLVRLIAANYDSVWDESQQESAVNAYNANCKQDWNS